MPAGGGPAFRLRHFEVETYAWSVLASRSCVIAELADGIALEMQWFADRAALAGLERTC